MGWQQKKAERQARRQAASAKNATANPAVTKQATGKPGPHFLLDKPPRFAPDLDEAIALLKAKRFEEADEILQRLNRISPNDSILLRLQVGVAAEFKDLARMSDLLERLVAVDADDPVSHLALFTSYAGEGYRFLATDTLRRFLARWPDNDLGHSIAKIENAIPRLLEDMGLTVENGYEMGCMHEEALSYLSRNRFADARRVAEQLMALQPLFIPARNNLAEALFGEGDYAAAVECLRRTLTFDPENVFASASLVRSLVFMGRLDEARVEAMNLERLPSVTIDGELKRIEALGLLGDDEKVLAAVETVRQREKDVSRRSGFLLDHYAAASLCRLGREREAKQLWQRALEHSNNPSLVQGNLDDLKKPVSQRHGGWVHLFSYWVPQPIVEDVARKLRGKSRGSASALELLRDHPDLEARIPILLDRGDPTAREFALIIAVAARTPAALAALRDFALSKRGPDELRMKAAMAANEAGIMPENPVLMWRDGEWRETGLLEFNINGEARNTLPPHLDRLAFEANEFLHEGNGKAAEEPLRKALAMDPNRPSLLYNLAAALKQQKRNEEADELMREIHQRFPDYFFGIMEMAQMAIDEGRLEDALVLLQKATSKKKDFHFSEFSVLAGVEIDYCLARHDRKGAKHWLKMLEKVQPDDRNLPLLKARIKWGHPG